MNSHQEGARTETQAHPYFNARFLAVHIPMKAIGMIRKPGTHENSWVRTVWSENTTPINQASSTPDAHACMSR